MGPGAIWIITGIVLILSGAGFFALTHTAITKWIRSFEKMHE